MQSKWNDHSQATTSLVSRYQSRPQGSSNSAQRLPKWSGRPTNLIQTKNKWKDSKLGNHLNKSNRTKSGSQRLQANSRWQNG